MQKTDPDDGPMIYEPSLWYFDQLAFLGQHDTSEGGIITLTDSEKDFESLAVSLKISNSRFLLCILCRVCAILLMRTAQSRQYRTQFRVGNFFLLNLYLMFFHLFFNLDLYVN